MKAVIYTRVSTSDQDTARQVEELREYARRNKYTVTQVIEEKITGASKAKDRKGFKILLDYVEKEKTDWVLVWELSRLGRSTADVLNTIETLTEKGIRVFMKKEGIITLDEKGKKLPMTTMLISVLSAVAEMERETIVQRSRSGLRHSIANGGAGQSLLKPFGYEKLAKKLVVNPEEAKTVKMMFSKYLSGLGTGQIAQYLNNEGYQTRYQKTYREKEIKRKSGFKRRGSDYKWVSGTVRSILRNTIYKGERKYAGEVFPIEPIVDSITFDKVQMLLTANFNKNDSKIKYLNPLKDVIRCGNPDCEKHGTSYFLHKRADGKDNAYKCSSKRLHQSCGYPSINYDKLLKALFFMCQPLIVNDAIKQTKGKQNVLADNVDNTKIQISNTQKEIVATNRKLDSLIEMNLSKQIDAKRFTTINSELLEKLNRLNSQMIKLTTDLKRFEKLTTTHTPDSDYSFEIFCEYLKDSVEFIKVYPVENMKPFRDVYNTFKGDVAVIIQVRSSVGFADGTPIEIFFTLSRYSHILTVLKFRTDTNLVSRVRAGQYWPDFETSLDTISYERPFKMKHNYITRRLK